MKKVKQMTSNERQYHWFRSGQTAKQRGHSQTCPFYDNVTAEYFFNCGYAGQRFEDAKAFLEEKLRELLQANPVIVESLNTLVERSKEVKSK